MAWRKPSYPCLFVVASLLLLIEISALVMKSSSQKVEVGLDGQATVAANGDNDSLRVAFLGNSILYFNDCPRMVEHLLKTRYSTVQQDSCLRGGATLVSLMEKGNGMRNKFGSPAAWNGSNYDIGAPTVQALVTSRDWDALVLHDHTQAPARGETRQATIEALRTQYGPLFLQQANPIRLVWLQTFAYRYPNMRGSDDLGDLDEYTQRLEDGYRAYQKVTQELGLSSKIAPMGNAVQYMHKHHVEMWGKLYAKDSFHPSPHATWLQACVLYCTIVEEAPPMYEPSWWETARYLQPPEDAPMLPVPTLEEAELLRQVAMKICLDA